MQTRLFRLRSSFSRDFFVLAAAVAFLLVLLALWIAYETWFDYQERMLEQMQADAARIDRTLELDIQQASYLLEAISRQIIDKGNNPQVVAGLLRSFSTEKTVFNIFAWADATQRIIVTGKQGVLPRTVDISDRDYIKKSLIMPGKVQIGRPVEGRLSGKWVVPLAYGVQDNNGNYLGAVLVSINIEKLTYQLKDAVHSSFIDFGVLTGTFILVAESSKITDFIDSYFPINALKQIDFDNFPQGRFKDIALQNNKQMLTYYQASANNPFLFLLGVDMSTQLWPLFTLLWQRLVPLVLIALFSGVALLVIRNRVIEPLGLLGSEAEKLIRGETLQVSVKGPSEITFLGRQLQHISAYIQERRRIEFEQKAKLAFLKRAKDTAELSNRVKVDFLTSMSHEFRTPLNTISGFIELMKNEVYGSIENERYRQYIADIHDSINAMQSLVSDVISLSKAESTQTDIHEKPVELQLVVARSIRSLADKLKEVGVTVENRVKEDIPKLRVDEGRLRQIIQNLLFNALSHTPAGGNIVIEARLGEDKLHQPVFEIIITDFGAKRLPGSRDEGDLLPRKSKKGWGKPGNLGVPLTKALVAMQQASLEVDSPPGKATTVTVRYPKEKIVL